MRVVCSIGTSLEAPLRFPGNAYIIFRPQYSPGGQRKTRGHDNELPEHLESFPLGFISLNYSSASDDGMILWTRKASNILKVSDASHLTCAYFCWIRTVVFPPSLKEDYFFNAYENCVVFLDQAVGWHRSTEKQVDRCMGMAGGNQRRHDQLDRNGRSDWRFVGRAWRSLRPISGHCLAEWQPNTITSSFFVLSARENTRAIG